MSSAMSQGGMIDGMVCDAILGGGWVCEADGESIVFCSAGEWWLLDCTAIDPDAFCGYDEAENVVDCYVIVECVDDGGDCLEDADCCSLVCGDDGTCGEDCSADGELCLE